ncbi:hypothetical protein M406DRAFT_58662 [Cryphonectria parasitica EP155]|uniref:Uncharacterized protein n=1 Tax=Cryphonectria parasitica (strain ATCC 38755 / EP155) TaxID=660469 RepID=A0A9P4Y4R3_CRYP1|nr:uncharacterized protein M406DRAFT_58662 [Cryphonectria parasitica EP155]KAF3766678.1 hypothetical protein M406DRAFT_58662 [Cryphonectria parasitica EP155]
MLLTAFDEGFWLAVMAYASTSEGFQISAQKVLTKSSHNVCSDKPIDPQRSPNQARPL